MLEDFHNTLVHIWIPHYLLLEGLCAELLHERLLLDFLCLIEMVEFAIDEFVDELCEVFTNLVEVNDLTILGDIRIGFVEILLCLLFDGLSL
jgi:hypothetical protein